MHAQPPIFYCSGFYSDEKSSQNHCRNVYLLKLSSVSIIFNEFGLQGRRNCPMLCRRMLFQRLNPMEEAILGSCSMAEILEELHSQNQKLHDCEHADFLQ